MKHVRNGLFVVCVLLYSTLPQATAGTGVAGDRPCVSEFNGYCFESDPECDDQKAMDECAANAALFCDEFCRDDGCGSWETGLYNGCTSAHPGAGNGIQSDGECVCYYMSAPQ